MPKITWLLTLGSLLLAKLSIAALYIPGGSAGVGNVAALVADITTANSTPQDDIIDLGGLIYNFTTFYDPTNGGNALPPIIDAATAGKLSIINGTIRRDFSLAPTFRLLAINSGARVYLYNLTLENGSVNNGITGSAGSGGAVFNEGFLQLTNCVVANNASTINGGAIANLGTIGVIRQTLLTGNLSQGGVAGAIFNDAGASIAAINDSIFISNQATNGGAFYNQGTIATITNTTIANNHVAGFGGGIQNEATGVINTISNSTFYGNSALGGGGIFNNQGTITGITNTTITNNQAINGGGGMDNSLGLVSSVFSTIIAGNQSTNNEPDYRGLMSTEGYNLFSSPPSFPISSTDIVQANASTFFGPLQNNGGKTPTVALLPASFAINNGYNINNLIFDQRGEPYRRIVYGTIDIGAYEFNSPLK